jgi:MFS family permease
MGTWMQKTAVVWVVYTMTHSAFMLGVTVFATQFPSFLFSLVGGVVADRYDRYKVLLFTQIASMIQAVLLAALVLSGHYYVWEILALGTVLGTINAFDVPARQPLVHELVNDKEDLPNALAFNSSMVNLAKLAGPALSGIVLQRYGAGICFLLNALSFIAVLSSLLLMRLRPYQPQLSKNRILEEMTESFSYIKNTPILRVVLLMFCFVSLFVLPYDTLLPVFAKIIFKGDAATFGYIRSFIGLGAVAGALVLASLKPGTNLKVLVLAGTVLLAFGLILFSQTTYFPLAMFFAVIFGFGNMAHNTVCLTIVQIHADPRMRGRVISYVAMVLFGMSPIGALIVGALSQKIGAQHTILLQGIIGVVIALIFSRFLLIEKMNAADKTSMQQVENEEQELVAKT